MKKIYVDYYGYTNKNFRVYNLCVVDIRIIQNQIRNISQSNLKICVVDVRGIKNHISAIYKRISIDHEAFKPHVSFVSAAFS